MSTGGSGNGIKNFDLVIGKQKFCTDNKHNRNFLWSRLCVRFNKSGCCFKRYCPLGRASKRTRLGGTPRLYQQGLLKDTDRRDVSAQHLTDPAPPGPPSHVVPCASLMEKGSEAFPCFYMNSTLPLSYSPYLFHPICLPFPSHTLCDIALNGLHSSF